MHMYLSCTYMFLCLHVHMYLGTQCKYSEVHECVEARGQHLVSSSLAVHLVYTGRGSHLNPELAISTSLVDQLALEIPCLHLQGDGIIGRLPCPCNIYVGPGHSHSCPPACLEVFYLLDYLSSSSEC